VIYQKILTSYFWLAAVFGVVAELTELNHPTDRPLLWENRRNIANGRFNVADYLFWHGVVDFGSPLSTQILQLALFFIEKPSEVLAVALIRFSMRFVWKIGNTINLKR
jgi:hypothetical protein